MQINTSRQILFTLLLLMPIILFGQIEQKKYVTRSGDTTLVINAVSTGLRGEGASFLLDEPIESNFLDKHSRYSKLRDAVQETQKVAKEINVEQKGTNPTTGSLGFWIAQQNIRYLRNEKEAERIAQDRMLNKNASVEELAYLIEKFGHKPSYFVNGVAVSHGVAVAISQKDILTKEVKVKNTKTGNPNGEIWYVITSGAYDKLDLGVSYADNSVKEEHSTTPIYKEEQSKDLPADFWAEPSTTNASAAVDSPALTPEQRKTLSKQEQEIEELRKAIQGYGKEPVVTLPAKSAILPATTAAQERTHYPAQDTETRVVNRRVGNRFVEDEIVSYRDSPQEKARRARDRQESAAFDDSQSGYEEDVLQVTNQAQDPEITKETPKRSIRRIKERQRNQ